MFVCLSFSFVSANNTLQTALAVVDVCTLCTLLCIVNDWQTITRRVDCQGLKIIYFVSQAKLSFVACIIFVCMWVVLAVCSVTVRSIVIGRNN